MIFFDNSNISNGFVQQAWLAYKGNNRWPGEGTDKYNKVLMIANRKLRELATRGTKNWSFYWDEANLTDKVAAGTQTYNLPANTIKLSDSVFIDDINGLQIAEYKVVKPQQRNLFSKSIFMTGENPRVINFSEEIKSGDSIVGETIRVPYYGFPTALSAATDEIPLNNAEWLVYEVAAELSRNDPAKDDQFPNLQGIANDKFTDMVNTDEGCPFAQPNAAAIVQPRIG